MSDAGYDFYSLLTGSDRPRSFLWDDYYKSLPAVQQTSPSDQAALNRERAPGTSPDPATVADIGTVPAADLSRGVWRVPTAPPVAGVSPDLYRPVFRPIAPGDAAAQPGPPDQVIPRAAPAIPPAPAQPVSAETRRLLGLPATPLDAPAAPAGGGGLLSRIFGGGGGGKPGPYDDILTPEQRQQLAWKSLGLGKMAAAFAEAAKPSLLPTGGLGAAIGKAAGASADAEEDAVKSMLGMSKVAQEVRDLRDKAQTRKELSAGLDQLNQRLAGRGSGVRVDTTTGSIIPPGGGNLRVGGALDLIEKYESGGRNVMQGVVGPGGGYNPSTGTVTGPSTAQGYYQITNSTWRDAAPKAGVSLADYPNAMSAPKDVQRAVAQQLYNERGMAPWAPYNANLRAAIARGEGGGGGAGAPAALPVGAYGAPGAPGAAGYDDSLALLLAQLGAKGQIAGFGDIAKPYETYLYNQPGYKGQVKRAETAGEWEVREPAEVRLKREQAELDTARERAAEEQRRISKTQEQRGAAELDITQPQWVTNPTTGQAELRPLTRLDLATRLGAPPAAPAAAPAAPAGPPPGASSLVPGGGLPFPVRAPQAAPGAPAGAPAAPAPAAAPAGPPGGVLPQPPEVPKDYRPVWNPAKRGWEVEAIPGSPAYRAQQEQDTSQLQTANRGIQSIDRALALSTPWSTGWTGSRLKAVEGSQAFNLSAELTQLQALTSFAELQKMRAGNPTGAALGAVSDTEGKKLESTVASLQQGQSKPQFDAALLRLRQEYLDTVYGSKEKLTKLVQEGKISQRVFDSVEALKARATAGTPPPPEAGKTPSPPMVGEIKRGYRFNGGNPTDSNNWTKVQ
jgi:hypothetical protein